MSVAEEENDTGMQPNQRLRFARIIDRPPLALPDGARLVLCPVLALEEWNIATSSAFRPRSP
jgi:hypothetical protein